MTNTYSKNAFLFSDAFYSPVALYELSVKVILEMSATEIHLVNASLSIRPQASAIIDLGSLQNSKAVGISWLLTKLALWNSE